MKRTVRIGVCGWLALACVGMSAVYGQDDSRRYVDDNAPPGGDGLSWNSAFTHLQDALAAAADPNVTEIRVAGGTYRPDRDEANSTGTANREATFLLLNGVTLAGGYAGYGAPDPDARDLVAYETILSGDLAGDDGPDFANNGENSYHITTGIGWSAAILDGFTVTAGNANGSEPRDRGAGMYNGGYCDPTVIDCSFVGNSANAYGGAMCNADYSNPTVTNCTFSGNSSKYNGGAISNDDDSSPMLTNCVIVGNSANCYGGGMCNDWGSGPTLTNCTFIGNVAGDGGGMCNEWYSDPTLTNCTFSRNLTGGVGGGMYNQYGSPTLTNCILWDNAASSLDQIFGPAIATYSDIQGGWSGNGNIDADPKFLDPSGGAYRLALSSPCIDAGDNYAVPPDTLDLDGDGDVPERTPLDLDLNPRFVDDSGTIDNGVADLPDYPDVVDMGAFEFQGHTLRTVYVNGATGDDAWEGSCDVWDGGTCGPKLTIQAGIDTASPGDVVEIADGTYTGAGNRDLDFGGKAITVRSASGHAQSCVIDCQGDWLNEHRGFLFDNNEGPEAVVEGLTITNGYGSSSGSTGVVAGGGVLCLCYGNPTFNNCVITGNTADFGGGIYCEDSMPTLNGCTISDNWGWAEGGGIYCIYGSNARLFDCVISGNYSSSDGGGVFSWKSWPRLVNCEINANSSYGYGGGVFSAVSYATLTNCALHENTALRGGALLCDSTTATITNCTFSANSADLGATMFCGTEWSWYPCTIAMSNCILWNGASQIVNNDGSTLTLTYCDVQGGWPGTGNTDADPLFADPDGPDDDPNTWTDNDYRLTSGSPCIDAGSNAAVPADLLFDLDGQPRITDGDDDGAAVVDMGAYERPAVIIGDMNCDGIVDRDDVNPFVWALLRPAQYGAQHPGCERMFADCNGDGLVDFADINPFIDLLLSR